MIARLGADLLERVLALTARDWCIAAAVTVFVLAVALIGISAGRIRDVLLVTIERVRRVELRLDRLQKLAERRPTQPVGSQQRDWRDSGQKTLARDSGETRLELKRPWAWWRGDE